MLESTPERSVAIVVGVDHYDYGENWRLAGPAADALRCVDWLITLKLQPKNIALFLSEKTWLDDADARAWASTNAWAPQRNASQEQIKQFVNNELPLIDAEAVFIYWGGHGVVDDSRQRNYLYTQDASQGMPFCVCVQELTSALHGPRFRHLKEQVVIVDACANPFSDSGETAQPCTASFVQSGAWEYQTHQFIMFAASAGRLAANISERKSGLFSEAIFKRLTCSRGPAWPDFLEAFDATVAGVEALNLGLQQPFLVIDWPGRGLRRSGRPPNESVAVTSLLVLIDGMAVSPAMLYRLYLRSLPDPTREVGNTSIEKWLHDLEDSRPRTRTHPSPLIEFAERLGRELENDSVKQWVIDNTRQNVNSRSVLYDALNAEQNAQRSIATLFVEVDVDQNNEIRWWVYTPDPAHCSVQQVAPITGAPVAAIAERLGPITGDAERVIGHKYDLVVSLIVSEKLLLSDLESTKVQFEDDGLPTRLAPLNQRYPVTLHWHKRARAPAEGGGRAVNAWKLAVETLRPRIQQGFGANVEWLEPALHDEESDRYSNVTLKLLSVHGTGICVGLGTLVDSDGGKPVAEVVGCLREGVPCFFWLNKPQEDEAAARKTLCDAFAKLKASVAPVEIGKLRKAAKLSDPLSSVRIVWDEPGYLPVRQPFDGPTEGDSI
jgi:hypothetical protein